MRRSYYIIVGLIAVLLFPSIAHSQIQSKKEICLNDLSNFSYTPPSGKKVKTYSWDFGDTYTSADASPFYMYKSDGVFNVVLKVDFVGGGNATEKFEKTVFALPKAKFLTKSNTDFCQYTNRIILTDQSTASHPSRPIVAREIIWGDGKKSNRNNPNNSSEYHSYSTADKFYLEMEVTDNKGCHSSSNEYLTIKEGITAKIATKLTFPDCGEAEVCAWNNSNFTTTKPITYQWKLGNKSSSKKHPYSDQLCEKFKKSENVLVELVATTSDGCESSAKKFVVVSLSEQKKKITTSKTEFCYGDKKAYFTVNKEFNERVRWYLNGDMTNITSANYVLDFDKAKIGLGTHKIKCIVSQGACIIELEKTIDILGPIAEFTLFNVPQCGANRRVFFVTDSIPKKGNRYEYSFNTYDAYGENCIINRAKNINKYKNCNQTIGWFGKHDYTLQGIYTVSHTIKDPVTGCSDTKTKLVNLDKCGNCNGRLGPFTVCQNSMFLEGAGSDDDPIKFSLDSGKTWLPYPSIIDESYEGWYDVMFIYKWKYPSWVEDYGDDSIKIHEYPTTFYDTINYEKLLFVAKAKEDEATISFSNGCNPMTAKVELKNGFFKAGESIRVYWGNRTFNKTFYKDDTLKSLSNIYEEAGGSGEIEVTLTTKEGCKTTFVKKYSFGQRVTIEKLSNFCVGEPIHIQSSINSFENNHKWRTDGSDGDFWWIIDDSIQNKLSYDYKSIADKVSTYNIGFVTKSVLGCTDTLWTKVQISDVKAGVKENSMLHYCKGQRQFFDSSYAMPPHYDYVSTYSWDFGSGRFSVLYKDPFQAFDGSKKVINVKHAVRTVRGCTDTVEFQLRVLASKPSFDIGDTLGCAPFTTEFYNNSVGANHFVWELGDVDNGTIQKTDKDVLSHTYKKAGRYKIRLIGIDSYFNDATQKLYYCHTIYPPMDEKALSVVALPSTHAGIFGPDTLCVNEEASFTSKSSGEYSRENWNFGNGTLVEDVLGKAIKTSYKKEGSYTITLDPIFEGHRVVPKCLSKVKKEVIVRTVKADFIIDPASQGPRYDFINLSDPVSAKYHWDFGQPKAGQDNFSSLKDPSHSYGKENGKFMVCLTSSLSESCKDSICKPIESYFNEEIQLYNVFTPGNDQSNDVYLVQLYGEANHEFTIYNRWGEIVFESKSSRPQKDNIIWNGRVNNTGAKCPEGTYFYVLKYSYWSSKENVETKSGTITLIRD